MKYLSTVLFILVVILFSCQLDPCTSKSKFLKYHDDFVEDTLEEAEDLSSDDWIEKDEEFDKLMDECYEKFQDDLSKSEKRDFWKNSSRYIIRRETENFSADLDDYGDEIQRFFKEDFSEMISDFKEDFYEVFDEDFKKEIREIFDDELKDDLKEAMNDIKDGLEEVGQELRELFEELKEDS